MPKDTNAADAASETMPEVVAPVAPVMSRDETIAVLVEQQRRQRLIDEAQAMADKQRAEEDAAAQAASLPEGWVWCRVLPNGDDRIFTGEEVRMKFMRYAKGDRFKAPQDTALIHQKNGLVEIV